MCLTEKQVGAYMATAFQRDEWPVLTQRQRVLDAAVRLNAPGIGFAAWSKRYWHSPASLPHWWYQLVRDDFARLWAQQ